MEMKWLSLTISTFVLLGSDLTESDFTSVESLGDAKDIYEPILYPYALGLGRPYYRGGRLEWSRAVGRHECKCGIRNRSVKNQDDVIAHVNEIPWRCYVNHPKISQVCGATIISSKWIMTAASCFNSLDDLEGAEQLDKGAGVTVTCGDHDRSTIKEVRHVTLNANSIILHENFSPMKNDGHDIALIRLSQELIWNDNISPVCLPFSDEGWDCEVNDTSVLASGWNSLNSDTESFLQRSGIPCLGRRKCREIYENAGKEDAVSEKLICTHKPGANNCPGDLGSSVDFEHSSGRYYAIGIAVTNSGCDENNPGLNTRVTAYLDWIKWKTGGERFCGYYS